MCCWLLLDTGYWLLRFWWLEYTVEWCRKEGQGARTPAAERLQQQVHVTLLLYFHCFFCGFCLPKTAKIARTSKQNCQEIQGKGTALQIKKPRTSIKKGLQMPSKNQKDHKDTEKAENIQPSSDGSLRLPIFEHREVPETSKNPQEDPENPPQK